MRRWWPHELENRNGHGRKPPTNEEGVANMDGRKRENSANEDTFNNLAPALKALAAVAFVNWFVFFTVSISIGGAALGTTPSQHGFVVTSHGHETAVTERVWLFSLYYPLATLALTPIVFFLVGLTQLHRLKRPFRVFIALFVLVWASGWYYALIRDSSHSIRDYLNMKSSPRSVDPLPVPSLEPETAT